MQLATQPAQYNVEAGYKFVCDPARPSCCLSTLAPRPPGVINYFDAATYAFPTAAVTFQLKLGTDLYCLARAKPRVAALGLEVSADGEQLAVVAADWKVRVLRFRTGRLRCVLDESLEAAQVGPGEGGRRAGLLRVTEARSL